MTCARIFVGLDYDKIEITARRLDENNSVNSTIVHVKEEWDVAMLKVEVHDCQFGVLVSDNALCCGQPLVCIGNLLHCVGSYMLGRVVFDCAEHVYVPGEEDKKMTCKTYVSTVWEYAPESRIFGDIWNEEFFNNIKESSKGARNANNESLKFEEKLHPLIPIVHCNGFSTQYGCWGGPIFNLRGEIVGMLVSTVDNYDIGIHVAVLRKFKNDVLEKTGGPSGLSGSAEIEGGLTMEGPAKKTRTR